MIGIASGVIIFQPEILGGYRSFGDCLVPNTRMKKSFCLTELYYEKFFGAKELILLVITQPKIFFQNALVKSLCTTVNLQLH